MFSLTLAGTQALIAAYGYEVLFPIAVVEGPIIGVIGGILVGTSQFNWLVALLVLTVADLVGDVAYYALGRYGHGPFMKGIAHRLGLTEEKIQPLEEEFKHHDTELLLIGKTQALGSVILYFAGAVRMPFWRFLFWNFLGTLPKVALFEIIGYFFGSGLTQTTKYLDYAGIATFVLAFLLLGSYFYFKRYLSKRLIVRAKVK
jgi:membrane protein DedA with SNARE-associated domain